MRLAALALIVLAFARPFLRRTEIVGRRGRGARGRGPARSLVQHGLRRQVGAGAGGGAERDQRAQRRRIARRSCSSRRTPKWRCDRRRTRAGCSRRWPACSRAPARRSYGPALKLAGSILSESALPRREVVLITDFQRGGWQGGDGVRLPDGAVLTPVAIADSGKATSRSRRSRCSSPSSRTRSASRSRPAWSTTATRRHRASTSRSRSAAAPSRPQRVDVGPRGSASATFDPVTIADRNVRAHGAARRRRAGARQRVSFRRLAAGSAGGRDRRARRGAAQRQPLPRARAGRQRDAALRRPRPAGRLAVGRRASQRGGRGPERRADRADDGRAAQERSSSAAAACSWSRASGPTWPATRRHPSGVPGTAGRSHARAGGAARRARVRPSAASNCSARRAAAISPSARFYSYRGVTPGPARRRWRGSTTARRRCSSGASAPAAC